MELAPEECVAYSVIRSQEYLVIYCSYKDTFLKYTY